MAEVGENLRAKVDALESTEQRLIRKLKRSCSGKRGSLTKRIAFLRKVITEASGRAKTEYLLRALLEVRDATKETFDKLSSLVDDCDEDWMESVDLDVDTCVAEVKDYLEKRSDNFSSADSITDSWVRKHRPRLT